jgi:hypothetical protein
MATTHDANACPHTPGSKPALRTWVFIGRLPARKPGNGYMWPEQQRRGYMWPEQQRRSADAGRGQKRGLI